MRPIVLHLFDQGIVELESDFRSFESFERRLCELLRERGFDRSSCLKYYDVEGEWVTFSTTLEFVDIPSYASRDFAPVHMMVSDPRFEDPRRREVARRLRNECGPILRRRSPWFNSALHEAIRRDLSPRVSTEASDSFFSYFEQNSNPFLKAGSEFCSDEDCSLPRLVKQCLKHLTAHPESEYENQSKIRELFQSGHRDRVLCRRLLRKFRGDMVKTKTALQFIEKLAQESD